MINPTDAVRPGTGDALTARTIDATVPPPLVRAQETVVALGPRIAQSVSPLTSPLFLGVLALTLLFVLVARRLRYQPSALVLSALLVMGLTSFRPLPKWELHPHVGSVGRPRTKVQARPQYWNAEPSLMPTPEPVEMPDDRSVPVVMPSLPTMPRSPESDVTVEIMRAADRMMRQRSDNEHMRAIMEELQWRLREEARNRRWRRMAAKYRMHRGDIDPIDLVLTR